MKVWIVEGDDRDVLGVFLDEEIAKKVYDTSDIFIGEHEVIEDPGERVEWITLDMQWNPGNPGGVLRGPYRSMAYEVREWTRGYWLGLETPVAAEYVSEPRIMLAFHEPHAFPCVRIHGPNTPEVRQRFQDLIEKYRADHPELVEGDPREHPALWANVEDRWVFIAFGAQDVRPSPNNHWKVVDGAWKWCPPETEE